MLKGIANYQMVVPHSTEIHKRGPPHQIGKGIKYRF